jgi:hypothetical protein
MTPDREHYRKLPGRRRGFVMGSSVWLGSDHLLLVRSSRFRETYRRFYFRDIQAIVTAKAPRFHISTRSAAIAAAWLVALAIISAFERGVSAFSAGARLSWIWWTGIAALAAAWVYVSAARSCRTRIYTAVSAEELPSLYRDWTARRFLSRVEPYVTQAQGAVEGNWAEAVEERQVGALPEGRVGLALPGRVAPPATQPPHGKAARTPVSILLVVSLLLGGLAELLTLGVRNDVARWVLAGFLLVQVTAAVAAIVQNFLGGLRASMRNLAIVTLTAIGVWYYAVQLGGGVFLAYQRGAMNRATAAQTPFQTPQALELMNYPAARGFAGGIGVLLGLTGVLLLLRREQPAEAKAALNV